MNGMVVTKQKESVSRLKSTDICHPALDAGSTFRQLLVRQWIPAQGRDDVLSVSILREPLLMMFVYSLKKSSVQLSIHSI